jgi:hypothetical protein
MSTIIDKSEKLQILTVDPLQALTIEHDGSTPKGEHQVRVSTKGIALGLGSSILIQHHAELILDGVVSADVLGTIDIGNNGRLFLNSSIGAGVLSTIQFTNTHGPAYLLINTAGVELTGNITGFGLHDTILLGNLGAVSASWTQGVLDSGTLALFNAAGTEVDAVGLNGEYTTANFAIKEAQGPHGTDTTRITFLPQDATTAEASGFTLPAAAPVASSTAPVFASLKDLPDARATALAFFGGVTHHG